jgi:thioredoxin reductase
MKSITIIGGGAAGLSFIRKCRELKFDGKITLVDKNTYWYDRAKFYNDFNFKSRFDYAAVCKEHKAQFIQDIVDRINPKRRKIYLKNRESIDFDTLVVAPGLKSKKIAVKGDHREGFYYLSDIDILQLRDRLKFSEDACVQVSTILGVKMVLFLKSLKKDVSVVADNLDFLSDKKELFLDWCKRESVSLYLTSHVEEAIGEATVRAVKLNPLKVISAQMLFLDSGFVSAADFFEEPMEEVAKIEGIHIVGDAGLDLSHELFFANNGVNVAAYAAALAKSLIENTSIEFTPQFSKTNDTILGDIATRLTLAEKTLT